MREAILERLQAIEREHDVQVVYAVESGSRAWGFASPDSDYDVRFLYLHPPTWYLSFDVERRRDVIEPPMVGDLDVVGWDVRKALHLFTRTNGALLEWLHSPIVYREHGDLAARLRGLAREAFDSRALCYHYSHMARGNARENLGGERVRLKKVLYVLRPLLAIRYVEAHRDVPPVAFDTLVAAVAPETIRPAISELLAAKRAAGETGEGVLPPVLAAFIRDELARHADGFHGPGRPDTATRETTRDALNVAFRAALHAMSTQGTGPC
ncbi:nucleotidyltransferase domain-containing protein [Aquisalimonas lutea]|uniref:nucleotidyltransferase domain-containing protein n=1 Tax=Aquisalimonas lutea TaxID=1327750 RepID=UPI0025B3A248|nr:nucleotidyltransferase domain-containing protein [Aquisalimonas lutea]MDN3517265.1 nucleotidyltransferase domain-containing protein [Aquisalimonas lutea]